MSTTDLILTIVAALLTLAASFKAGKFQEQKKQTRKFWDEFLRTINQDGEQK